jgi:hypothetical protein
MGSSWLTLCPLVFSFIPLAGISESVELDSFFSGVDFHVHFVTPLRSPTSIVLFVTFQSPE